MNRRALHHEADMVFLAPGPERAAQHPFQRGALPIVHGQKVVLAGQGEEPGDEGIARLCVGALQGLDGHRLDRGQRVLHPVVQFVQKLVLVPLDTAAMFDLQRQHVGRLGALALGLEGLDIDDGAGDLARHQHGEIVECLVAAVIGIGADDQDAARRAVGAGRQRQQHRLPRGVAPGALGQIDKTFAEIGDRSPPAGADHFAQRPGQGLVQR